jgi:hypothetical protein
MNLGDLKNVIVVTACDPCDDENATIWPRSNFSHEFVHVAAPGQDMPGPAYDRAYTVAGPGTSQATAFVGSVVADMISCYPDEYVSDDFSKAVFAGRVKLWLQLTSRPLKADEARAKLSAGVVDPRAALNDPDLNCVVANSPISTAL